MIEYHESCEAVTVLVSDMHLSGTAAALNEHAPPAADSGDSTAGHCAAPCGPAADAALSDGWEWRAGDGHDDPDPRDEDYDQDAEHRSWLRSLPADVRAEYEAGPWTGAGESIPAGFLHHDHDGPAGAGSRACALVPGRCWPRRLRPPPAATRTATAPWVSQSSSGCCAPGSGSPPGRRPGRQPR